MQKCKVIFVAGGVCSSLGKGVTVASISHILRNKGFKINLIKLDPYLNISAGNMSPLQHGEVYVTKDGAETDLDLGHYERFGCVDCNVNNNITSGQVYKSIITKMEEDASFAGSTIQIIPHITDEIKSKILDRCVDTDFLFVEIGGVVGDIEGQPFLEATRQMLSSRHIDTMFMYIALAPFLQAINEIKTKPVQHSINTLRSFGITPDILICRSSTHLDNASIEKIKMQSSIDNVFYIRDVNNVYEVPQHCLDQGIHEKIFEHFSIEDNFKNFNIDSVNKIAASCKLPINRNKTIGIIGKYFFNSDAYESLYASLNIAYAYLDKKEKPIFKQISTDVDNFDEMLKSCDGIICCGGFGNRGLESKINAAGYAINNDVPFLGICLGMQASVIAFARKIYNNKAIYSEEQGYAKGLNIVKRASDGIMKLGYQKIDVNGRAAQIYGSDTIYERHRHRYFMDYDYVNDFEKHGCVFSFANYEGAEQKVVSIMEIPGLRWFFGTQFHPEYNCNVDHAHPLFSDFLRHVVR